MGGLSAPWPMSQPLAALNLCQALHTVYGSLLGTREHGAGTQGSHTEGPSVAGDLHTRSS